MGAMVNPTAQDLAKAVLAAHARGVDTQALIERVARPVHIDPVKFITSREWLGLNTIFPGIIRLVAMICQPVVRKYHVEAGKGSGKAQPVDEPVLTPESWRKIGDLRPGDKVIAGDGTTTCVLGVHPQGVQPVVRVIFDGPDVESWTRCTMDHLWTVKLRDEDDQSWRQMPLAEMMNVWRERRTISIPFMGNPPGDQRILRTIQEDGEAPCCCITVAHPMGTYITRHYIVTHNSTAVALVLTYSAAELLTMSDPHAYFNLDLGKPISIVNVSTSEAQARTTVFTKLKAYVQRCPALRDRAKIGALSIAFDVSGEFPDGRVLMVCGHSRSEGLEGHDVYAAILDEANKHLSPAGRSNAKAMFDMLVSSAETRFPKHFRVGTISSSVSMSDFQREEIEAVKKRGRRIPWPS